MSDVANGFPDALALADPLALTVEEQIPRDRWNRPLITPPEGGKAVAYTRCTTFIKSIDGDPSNLILFNQRHTAMGLATRKDLYMAAATAGDGVSKESKDKLNKIVKEAAEASGVHASATIGTALHAATESFERGESIDHLPQVFHADLNAYITAMRAAGIRTLQVENFGVHDDLKVGGTWDRILEVNGRTVVGDVKTGRVDDFSIGKIALQLSIYAHSKVYDPATGARTPLDGVDLERALIIHLPQGQATCNLIWVNIAAGWEAVQYAKGAREWQAFAKMKNLAQDFTVEQPALTEADVSIAGAERSIHSAPSDWPAPDAYQVPAERALLNALHEAPTVDELLKLWQDFHTIWTDEHTAAANARKAQLTP